MTIELTTTMIGEGARVLRDALPPYGTTTFEYLPEGSAKLILKTIFETPEAYQAGAQAIDLELQNLDNQIAAPFTWTHSVQQLTVEPEPIAEPTPLGIPGLPPIPVTVAIGLAGLAFALLK